MARRTRILLAACLLAWWPSEGQAGDAFTGFQVDNKGQYYGFVGVKVPMYQLADGTELFVQAMSAALGYSYRERNQTPEANIQFIVPSLGLRHTFGSWTLSALAGPQLRRIEQERVGAGRDIQHQIGGYGQLEALYWHKQGSVHLIGSYAGIDNFFWGRIRGKRLVSDPSRTDRVRHSVGYDLAGMGNADFRAVQTGPVYEIAVGNFFFLIKGGYQYNNTFHSGGYGGAELYFPF